MQEGFAAFERLSMTDPERDKTSKALSEEAKSASWDLEELSRAVGVAAKDPARFNIDQKEIEARRQWVDSTRSQV